LLSYITYKNENTTQWVTLIHGAGGSLSIWYKQLRSYKENFNVLLVDLRGHGNSKADDTQKNYTFDLVSEDVLEVLDFLKIKSSHFIGISLGTILIRNLAKNHPDRIDSMILAGAIMKLDLRSQILMKLGVFFKDFIPYLLLYKFFAFIIMPKKNHRASRKLFVTEAKKLKQKEFIKWFKLASEINPLLTLFRNTDTGIKTLYIMGAEDHLFINSVKQLTLKHEKSDIYIIENSGHVVNVEKALEFNSKTIEYINSI